MLSKVKRPLEDYGSGQGRKKSIDHSVEFTGQCRVMRNIIEECAKKKLRVAVVCSSGIAYKVYPPGSASTVHSYYGFGAADLPSSKIIERAKSNSIVSKRVRDVDVLISDEASMSSARMLELVNCFYRKLAGSSNVFPFAGRQIIIVG